MNIRIKKGLNLRLEGGISNLPEAVRNCRRVSAATYAVCPDDYPGFKPKAVVREGDAVEGGAPVLINKDYEAMSLVSPVRGTVKAVVRGDRRRILRVEIEAAEELETLINEEKPLGRDGAEIATALAKAGLLARFRERPYDVVPSAGVDKVRDIYVMAFDNAPLAVSPVMTWDAPNTGKCLARAAEILGKLTDGKVYFVTDHAVSAHMGAKGWTIPGVETVQAEGPYPSSLPGTIIAATRPLNKGERVWTLDATTMLRIGELSLMGHVSFDNTVAVTGSEVRTPCLVKALDGAPLSAILEGNIKDNAAHKRIISGNVLTGVREDMEGYLRFPYRQVTVIPEGDDVDEFMGWASLAPSKTSVKPSFPFSLTRKKFAPDARLNGGRRAMIMSGEYDKYMPMDILPEYLLKAIIAKDIDNMERLGIYEVAPEDFALAEFADTSKLPLQQIVRDGLDYLRKELE